MVPVTFTGFDASNSADSEWWARIGWPTMRLNPTTKKARSLRVIVHLIIASVDSMKWVLGSQFLKQHKLSQTVLVFAASEDLKMPKCLDRKYPHLGGNIIGGDRNTFYPALWSWLVRRFDISTVLDVGCGEGHAMAEFSALGCEVHGI